MLRIAFFGFRSMFAFMNMKKRIQYGVLILFVGFLAMQFFQPTKNLEAMEDSHILKVENVPDTIQILLQSACLDCHSNQTRYKFYHNIAPLSWMISKHIDEGKEELNLSDWGIKTPIEKISLLDKMAKEVEHETMPLPSYQMIHPEVRWSDAQKTLFITWSESLAEKVLIEAQE